MSDEAAPLPTPVDSGDLARKDRLGVVPSVKEMEIGQDKVWAASEKGPSLKYQRNEDSYWPFSKGDFKEFIDDILSSSGLRIGREEFLKAAGTLLMVADGVSGGLKGDFASTMAVQQIAGKYYWGCVNALKQKRGMMSLPEQERLLRQAIKDTNRFLITESENIQKDMAQGYRNDDIKELYIKFLQQHIKDKSAGKKREYPYIQEFREDTDANLWKIAEKNEYEKMWHRIGLSCAYLQTTILAAVRTEHQTLVARVGDLVAYQVRIGAEGQQVEVIRLWDSYQHMFVGARWSLEDSDIGIKRLPVIPNTDLLLATDGFDNHLDENFDSQQTPANVANYYRDHRQNPKELIQTMVARACENQKAYLDRNMGDNVTLMMIRGEAKTVKGEIGYPKLDFSKLLQEVEIALDVYEVAARDKPEFPGKRQKALEMVEQLVKKSLNGRESKVMQQAFDKIVKLEETAFADWQEKPSQDRIGEQEFLKKVYNILAESVLFQIYPPLFADEISKKAITALANYLESSQFEHIHNLLTSNPSNLFDLVRKWENEQLYGLITDWQSAQRAIRIASYFRDQSLDNHELAYGPITFCIKRIEQVLPTIEEAKKLGHPVDESDLSWLQQFHKDFLPLALAKYSDFRKRYPDTKGLLERDKVMDLQQRISLLLAQK